MKAGIVKFYNKEKGFGFIIDEETQDEIFVHATGITQGETIQENDYVQFNTKQGKKGLNAIDVVLAN